MRSHGHGVAGIAHTRRRARASSSQAPTLAARSGLSTRVQCAAMVERLPCMHCYHWHGRCVCDSRGSGQPVYLQLQCSTVGSLLVARLTAQVGIVYWVCSPCLPRAIGRGTVPCMIVSLWNEYSAVHVRPPNVRVCDLRNLTVVLCT
jgi:hypothetical protein